tara:strand:+ start:1086 stop:1232 length:147 start_codon:yes stop_codon:yes gene_type:complete
MENIQDFKDGVSDGLLVGVIDENKNSHFYKIGYDFGLTLWNQQQEKDD